MTSPAVLNSSDVTENTYNSLDTTGPSVQSGSAEDAKTSTRKDSDRETWAGKTEFLLSCIGYAVGLGNVWRFPHRCYTNGGGAFLFPYVFMLTCAGLPLFFLELAIGQYASLGPITVWRCSPLFKGMGYTMVGLSVITSVYYNVILSFTIFYFFASFTNELPWAHCNNTWNTLNCTENHYLAVHFEKLVNSSLNVSLAPPPEGVTTSAPVTINQTDPYKPISPSEEFWNEYVFDITDGIHHLGGVRWHLALCLLLAWIVVYLCIIKGIRSTGKVVYFTATFPYFMLLILFIRGMTLPGALDGIKFYLTPQFEKMKHAQVWKEAAVQILYSLGPGFGSLLTMGSYNKFHNNCHFDAILVAIINCSTSLFAGFVIFSVMGYMAHETGLKVENVVDAGPGLAFIAYPSAIAMMPGAPFWSICFFLMLFTLGLDSMFATMECTVTAFTDEFPILYRYKPIVTFAACVILFLFGLPCVTQGGIYVIELIDKYAAAVPLLVVTSLECIIVSWVYGWRRFVADIKLMIGFKPNLYWVACWTVVAPLIILFILVFSCIEYDGLVFRGYQYPKWAESVGWLIVVAALISIPTYMIYLFARKVETCQNFRWVITGPSEVRSLNLRGLITPDEQWGPRLQEDRIQESAIASLENMVRHRPDSEVQVIIPANMQNGGNDGDESYI